MNNKEKRAEELLHLLGDGLSKERFHAMNEFSNSSECGKSEDMLSERDKQYGIVKHIKKQRKFLRVGIIILCVIIGATAVTTTVSEAFRTLAFGFFFEKKEGHEDMFPSGERQVLYPSYIPKGYQKISEEKLGEAIEIAYQKGDKEEYIIISEEFGDNVVQSFDTENTKREGCLVGNYEAWYFSPKKTSTGDMHTLIWQQGNVLMEINSQLEKEEMIKIAISLD